MNYKIPDNIKTLCDKGDLSNPVEQELVKQELVIFLKTYLSVKKGKETGKKELSKYYRYTYA